MDWGLDTKKTDFVTRIQSYNNSFNFYCSIIRITRRSIVFQIFYRVYVRLFLRATVSCSFYAYCIFFQTRFKFYQYNYGYHASLQWQRNFKTFCITYTTYFQIVSCLSEYVHNAMYVYRYIKKRIVLKLEREITFIVFERKYRIQLSIT